MDGEPCKADDTQQAEQQKVCYIYMYIVHTQYTLYKYTYVHCTCMYYTLERVLGLAKLLPWH